MKTLRCVKSRVSIPSHFVYYDIKPHKYTPSGHQNVRQQAKEIDQIYTEPDYPPEEFQNENSI